MPRLDLKILAHHGSIVRHRIAGREELVGTDVIVAHRLLKNHVVERLGIPAYALFSEACVAAMAVDPVALGMTEYRDDFEGIGEVGGWVHDLGAAWNAEQDRNRVIITERDAGFVLEVIQPAPRDIAGSFMTDPAIRPRWQAGVEKVDELPTAPRRGIGTTSHCMHGKDVLIEEILDWRPTDYLTLRTTLPNRLKSVSTYAYEDAPRARGSGSCSRGVRIGANARSPVPCATSSQIWSAAARRRCASYSRRKWHAGQRWPPEPRRSLFRPFQWTGSCGSR
jgi:hypothetical protein